MSGELSEITVEVQSGLREARRLLWAARGWEQLGGQQAGSPYQPQPHNDRARATFEAGLQVLGDDPALLHHLAVAEHARAWDLELEGSVLAPDAWRRALDIWHRLHGCPAFWQSMRERAAQLQPPVDPAVVDELRAALYGELLGIHVAFVRHYCDQGDVSRARPHVELIRQTQLPPAVHEEMPELLYAAMTGSLGDLMASQEYDQAARTIERYLEFYPDHLRALQTLAEILRDWARVTSAADDWPTVMEIAQRAGTWARELDQHEALEEAPLARLALTRLGATLARRFYRKLSQVFSDAPDTTAWIGDEHLAWADQAVRWAELAHDYDASREYMLLLSASLYLRARCATALGDTSLGLTDYQRHIQLTRRIEQEE
ncbi:MAG: hypothetical protein U9R79_09610 [Armatimonadota bacterium]|nr:hypothetical protein [Armatimonadota bacterium]